MRAPAPALGPGPRRPPSVVGPDRAESLRRLELTVARRLDGLLHGDQRGLVPGHGSEPGKTRAYQPGDDVRRMDWNVTARLQDPHVREAVADRELETWVVLDASASLAFGTAWCEKRDLALGAVAAVGFLTARTGNRVGAVALGPGGPVLTPARPGRPHLLALLARAADALARAGGAADLGAGVHALARTRARRGLVVVVSDFLDPGDWHHPLRALSGRHEVLAVEVVDPRELELPDVGLLEVEDPETGARLEVQTARAGVRARFAEAAAAQRAEVARRLRAAGTDHLRLRTDRDWLVDLARFVAERRRRVAALARPGVPA